jgi:hypothetical protein
VRDLIREIFPFRAPFLSILSSIHSISVFIGSRVLTQKNIAACRLIACSSFAWKNSIATRRRDRIRSNEISQSHFISTKIFKLFFSTFSTLSFQMCNFGQTWFYRSKNGTNEAKYSTLRLTWWCTRHAIRAPWNARTFRRARFNRWINFISESFWNLIPGSRIRSPRIRMRIRSHVVVCTLPTIYSTIARKDILFSLGTNVSHRESNVSSFLWMESLGVRDSNFGFHHRFTKSDKER